MYPPVWGPTVWGTIHLMAYTYPDEPTEERQKSMSDFLVNMCTNLPCIGCGIHCRNYVATNPPLVDNKTNLKRWAYDFHNAVNVRTNKQCLTYEEAEEALSKKYFQYEQWKAIDRAEEIREEDHRTIDKWKKMALNPTCDDTNLKIVSIVAGVFIVFLIVVIITILIKQKKKKSAGLL